MSRPSSGHRPGVSKERTRVSSPRRAGGLSRKRRRTDTGLGRLVLRLITWNGETVAGFARKNGINESALRMLTRGYTAEPGVFLVERVALGLGIPMGSLMDRRRWGR